MPPVHELIALPSGLSLETRLYAPKPQNAKGEHGLVVCLHPWSRLGGDINDSCVNSYVIYCAPLRMNCTKKGPIVPHRFYSEGSQLSRVAIQFERRRQVIWVGFLHRFDGRQGLGRTGAMGSRSRACSQISGVTGRRSYI